MLPFIKKIVNKKKLLLPQCIYAMPGLETNVYFANIFLTINPANFSFSVRCKKGRCDEKRWHIIPTPEDIGEYSWNLMIEDDSGIVTEQEITLKIIPVAPKDKTTSVLIFGDSEIEGGKHAVATRFYELCKENNIPLHMIGTNGPDWPDVKGEIRDEGYGGWNWHTFLAEGSSKIDPKISYCRMNPFWNEAEKRLDLPAYFSKNGTPDRICICLGTNDMFGATQCDLKSTLKKAAKNIRTMILALRKAAPDVKIGLLMPDFCSGSQDAFGKCYGSAYFRWRFKRNIFAYNKMLQEMILAENDPSLTLIPAYMAVDHEYNVLIEEEPVNAHKPQTVLRHSNGVHPDIYGFRQAADLLFFCFNAE